MIRFILLGFLTLAGSAEVRADIIITEIMFNPSTTQGADSTHEYWVLFNSGAGSVDISNYRVRDATNSVDFTSTPFVFDSNRYLILTELTKTVFETDFVVTVPSNADFLTVSSNITFLNNAGETVALTDGTNDIFSFTYTDSLADGNGNALLISDNGAGGAAGFTEGSPLSSIAAVPEPSSLLLVGIGVFTPILRRRR